MVSPKFQQRHYARDERLADGLVHALAIVSAVFGTAYVLARNNNTDTVQNLALAIYMAALLTMLGCSAAYNMTSVSPLKWLLRRFDHSAIYVMIAGTYTPLLLQLPDTHLALLLAAVVWLGAILGIAFKVLAPGRFDGVAVIAYLALGWVGVFAATSFLHVLPGSTLALIVVGGLLYSAGVPFFLWETLKFQNAIWHLFVAAAAAAQFIGIAILYI